MQKDYGKLTTAQFQTLICGLGEVNAERTNFSELMARVPKEKLDAVLIGGFNWGALYELPFVEHLALVAVAFNYSATLTKAVASPDPQQHILDHLHPPLEFEAHPAFELQQLIGLALSLQRTILSIMLFQRSLSGLVQEVREEGNLDALFNAVRVDRTVMTCPSVADKIAMAELRGDKHFFLRLRNSLKGPSHKHWAAYCDLRYSLYVLRELGFDKMTDDQLEQLLVHTLKVYPDTPTARKNLRAQYQQSKKIRTI